MKTGFPMYSPTHTKNCTHPTESVFIQGWGKSQDVRKSLRKPHNDKENTVRLAEAMTERARRPEEAGGQG